LCEIGKTVLTSKGNPNQENKSLAADTLVEKTS
jgi:hypothetical protein